MTALMTVSEVAERMRISVSSVYVKVADGSLPHYKIGGAVRISEVQLASYLASKERGKMRRAPAPVTLKHLVEPAAPQP